MNNNYGFGKAVALNFDEAIDKVTAVLATEGFGVLSDIDVAAIAAIRATREATVKQGGETLDCIAGIPIKGEELAGETFDGKAEAAIFPGDLPDDPHAAIDGSLEGELKFVRFRPPLIPAQGAAGANATFPHIRLDRTLEFLVGDRLA